MPRAPDQLDGLTCARPAREKEETRRQPVDPQSPRSPRLRIMLTARSWESQPRSPGFGGRIETVTEGSTGYGLSGSGSHRWQTQPHPRQPPKYPKSPPEAASFDTRSRGSDVIASCPGRSRTWTSQQSRRRQGHTTKEAASLVALGSPTRPSSMAREFPPPVPSILPSANAPNPRMPLRCGRRYSPRVGPRFTAIIIWLPSIFDPPFDHQLMVQAFRAW